MALPYPETGKAANAAGEYGVWTIELPIPLARIGTTGKAGDGIGFDVVWHGADHDGPGIANGTWRGAGRSTGIGSLFFAP